MLPRPSCAAYLHYYFLPFHHTYFIFSWLDPSKFPKEEDIIPSPTPLVSGASPDASTPPLSTVLPARTEYISPFEPEKPATSD